MYVFNISKSTKIRFTGEVHLTDGLYLMEGAMQKVEMTLTFRVSKRRL
jgi:hypothetical protein